MNDEIADILGDDDPKKRLDRAPESEEKARASQLLRIMEQPEGPKNLTADQQTILWARIEATTRKTHLKRRMAKIGLWGAAASLVLAATVVWLGQRERTADIPRIELAARSQQHLSLDTGEIHLINDDRIVLLDENSGTLDLSLLQTSDDTGKPGAAFTTLTVPYGKRIEVSLPDNSRIWLNAGSQLTFPVQFEPDKREVYLEGEGFFDVVTDTEKPFYVHTSDMVIKVLGTTFNVSSYREDDFSAAVLLTGSIELYGNTQKPFEALTLLPGSSAVLQRAENTLRINQENVEDQISWTHRQLILRSTPLDELLVRLARAYNSKITEDFEHLSEETFSGRLDLTQPLIVLLSTIYDRNVYDIQQNERRFIIRKK